MAVRVPRTAHDRHSHADECGARHAPRRAAVVSMLSWLASCSSLPQSSEPSWLDEDALRSCLAAKLPADMMDEATLRAPSVSLDLVVLPSGRIQSVALVSGSGSPAVDRYVIERFSDPQCAPFAAVDSPDAYSVELEIDIRTRQ
jgi:hypothetical protein